MRGGHFEVERQRETRWIPSNSTHCADLCRTVLYPLLIPIMCRPIAPTRCLTFAASLRARARAVVARKYAAELGSSVPFSPGQGPGKARFGYRSWTRKEAGELEEVLKRMATYYIWQGNALRLSFMDWVSEP